MSMSAHSPIRPILVGGVAAIGISLAGVFFSGHLDNWWWHLGTIGSAVAISLVLALMPNARLDVARRIFLAATLGITVLAGVVYAIRFVPGAAQLFQAVEGFANRNSIGAGIALGIFSSYLFFPSRRLLIALIGIVVLLIIGSRTALIALLIGIVIAALMSRDTGQRSPFLQILGIGLIGVLLFMVFLTPKTITDRLFAYEVNGTNRIAGFETIGQAGWPNISSAEFDLRPLEPGNIEAGVSLTAKRDASAQYANIILSQSYGVLPPSQYARASVWMKGSVGESVILSTNILDVLCPLTTEWTLCETPLSQGNDSTYAQWQLRYPKGTSSVSLSLRDPALQIISFPQFFNPNCGDACAQRLGYIRRLLSRFQIASWGEDTNISNRIDAQIFAFDHFLERPTFGWGLDTFKDNFAKEYPEKEEINHPHSLLFEILYGQGLIGLASLVLLFAGVIVAIHPRSEYIVPMLIFLVALQAADSTFYFNMVFYPFWVSLNLLRRDSAELPDHHVALADSHRVTRRFGVVLDILVLVVALLLMRETLPSDSITQQFVLAFSVLATTIWFIAQTSKRAAPTALQDEWRILLIPVWTGLTAILLFSVTGVYYSVAAISVFVLTSTIGLLITRVIFRKMQPRPRVLLVGESRYLLDFVEDPAIVATKWGGGGDIGDYDYVVVGSESQQSELMYRWSREQHTHSAAVMSDVAAAEALHGRFHAHVVTPEWVAQAKARATSYLPLKRVLESLLIILFSPIILIVAAITAILVLISVGRPVIFSQPRVGLNNQPFTIYKFRTMRGARTDGPAFADEEAERITKIGRILRGFRLDEIPQFWNVLKGDMSIIGPRPEQVEFAEQFEQELPAYGARHVVRPGITGWAQVNQGYAAGADETLDKLSYDFFYIKHFSPWLDLVIVGRTIMTILTKFGAK